MPLTTLIRAVVPRRWQETVFLRLWSLANVRLLWFVRPSVVERTEEKVVVRIPLSRRTRNHLQSMYFGVLCAGADCAGGLLAMQLIEASGERVSLIFKDFNARFLKRAEGDVHFTCADGASIANLVREAIRTGERQNATVHVTATVPSRSEGEPVAEFELTLSLKKRH
ncbi:MAG: DUF4442 domain-containing protein [Acidobacteriota bacterium]